MPVNRQWLRQSLAPADHLAIRQRRKPHMTLVDRVQNETPKAFERRRLERGEIAPLARDGVEEAVETLDMLRGDRGDLDHVISVMCAMQPLADRSQKNYLGSDTPTMDPR